MNPLHNQFDRIAPEVIDQVLPRRKALRHVGAIGAGAFLATIPSLVMANRALAATNQQVHGVLNFALTLEYLEESFYRQGLDAAGLIPSADQPVYDQILKHEQAHVTFLTSTINSLDEAPVEFTDADFDFTADGTYPAFTDYPTFMALAQGFEDTGVRAYKGQAAALYSEDSATNPVLTAALQIHSVEARHAAKIRRMRGQAGWITGDGLQGLPAGFEAIYAGEATVTHGGVNVVTASSVSMDRVTESFDEPLTTEQVLAIAGPFLNDG